jgi:hypothetical protein
MTENKTQLLGDLGFLIIQFMIITIKLGNVITSKLVHHKTVDKSPAIMILEQGTLKTVILKYEIAEYNNPLDYMRAAMAAIR